MDMRSLAYVRARVYAHMRGTGGLMSKVQTLDFVRTNREEGDREGAGGVQGL